MTFLLQKFNAINRSRTEVRARKGLRPTASGIAFTGRLAACLLLAGFLGVGSAIAQPHVLRMGDGSIMVPTTLADGTTNNAKVHHYVIGDAGTNDPTSDGDVSTFLVGSIALVTHDDTNDMLMVTPVGPGNFKIALAPSATVDLGDDNVGTPVNFEIMSVNAPMLTGAATNAAVQADMEPLNLTPRDDTSKEYDLLDWFSDPNDVFLTFTAKADQVDRCDGVAADCPKKKKVDVVTATVDGNMLTIALTAAAKNDSSDTDVWVFAHDSKGEYARKRVHVEAGSPTNPYVMTALKDVVIREGATEDKVIPLSGGFVDPETLTDRSGSNDAMALAFEISVSDASAQKVGTGDEFTWVASYMVATVMQGATASVSVRPRAPGSVTFTVRATDKGVECRADHAPARLNDDDGDPATPKVYVTGGDTADDPFTKCLEDNSNPQKTTALYPDAASISDSFTLTIITRTTPMAAMTIPAQSVVADKEAITLDLEDLNGDKDGDPDAFSDPTTEGLTYMVEAKDAIAMLSVEGSVVTIAPIWRAGNKSTSVKVTATNNLDESITSAFALTVTTATLPVVNPHAGPLLAGGFMLNTGDESLTLHLRNLTGAEEAEDYVPLFIDPNANKDDSLPGGLLYKMQIKDVEALHRYDDLSSENDVYTSAMRITLDPAAATLTVMPTGANYAKVTVWGIDRERLMVSATTTITVVSCDGVDMSDPCDGVTVGTENEELPTEVSLSQNYPNPFNPQTTIDYALPQAGNVSLVVYDMLGREVDVLLDGPQAAGRHTVRFGANHLPNGTYVYRLVAADKTITRTMVLVK